MRKIWATYGFAGRARSVLLLSVLFCAAAFAQQRTAFVTGKVLWDSTKGSPTIPNARVEILEPVSTKAGRVWRWTTADIAADYKIENISEGSYDIVACDDLLQFKPRRQPVQVPRNGTVLDLRLPRNDPSPTLTMRVGKGMIVYLKHIETGCEFAAKAADRNGVVSIPNTVNTETLDLRYGLCIDDAEEDDSKSPFELCVRKELRGLSWNEVQDKLGPPNNPPPPFHKHKGREVFIYRYVKVTFQDGKVSGVSVELVPSPCKPEKPCEAN